MDEPIRTEPGACALCGAASGTPLARGWDFEYATTRDEFTFRRCGCGGVFLDPRPAPESLGIVYPSNYYAYDFERKLGPITLRFKAFADRAKVKAYTPYLKPGARVLDVGCGDGHVLRQIRGAAGIPLELEGVEFSERAVEAARRDGFRVYQGSIEDVELPADAFDLVIMNQLIEHVREPRVVLERIGRALKPGGHLFIETPNIDSLDARLFRRRYWGGYHLPRHFHLFDTRALVRLVELAGLERVAHQPLVCPQFWIISVQNWLKDRGHVRFAERALSPFNPLLLAPVTVFEILHQRVWWTSNQQLVARRAR
ncbi:MAG TPA: class I SAM-dependent methyltransferase [Candidatus Binatia bacterium]